MSNLRVVNSVKDRCRAIRKVDHETYEWGWSVVNKRDRDKDYFNKVGQGSLDEALQWADSDVVRVKVAMPIVHGPDR